ncbi:MAG TPA: hypothetical protein VMV69_01590 [Pirellulales bacterium]|nr:hypothetical protein [Pirellulales bacterium]
MSPETVQQMLHRQPFEPFEVRLSNGELHQVRHPENALVSRTRLVVVYPDSETDRMVICDLNHVNAIEFVRNT